MDFKQAAIVTRRLGAGWFRAMASEIHRGLQAHGVAAHLVDMDVLPEFWSNGAGRDPRTMFVDFNRRITYPERRPAVSVMVDHPCSLMKELGGEHSADTMTGWVDASHLDAVKMLGFAHRATFLPHAGPAPRERPTPMAEREIDIFFAGSLEDAIARPVRAKDPAGPLDASELVFDAIEIIEETGAPVLPAVLKIMEQRGIPVASFARGDFAQLMALVLRIAETNRRLNVLMAIPDDLTIAIASSYLPAALSGRPNVRHLGHIDDFEQIRGHMRNARIVLNTTAKFPFGSHERIWYAMAEGALVLTDSSAFMKQDFVDGENILYLSQKHLETADLAPLGALAQDNATLARMTESASIRYRERHTWEKRAPFLIEAMRAA
jgi:glycosyl transferase family 1